MVPHRQPFTEAAVDDWILLQSMKSYLKSSLATILSFFRWLHRKAYNWIHLQLAHWRLTDEQRKGYDMFFLLRV